MKVTNKANLPQPIYDAIIRDGYSRGDADISVTELLSPARISALKAAHWQEIEEDASDRVWSLVGQVMHGILERSNRTGIAERRLSVQVEGWKVSGGMDAYYDHGLLQDYKFVTAYKFKGGTVPQEYEQQLNCYAEILRANGDKVERLEIVAILRDWSKMEARRDPNYPQSQVLILPVTLWPQDIAQKFMRERVVLHKSARIALPRCTDEERWAKPAQWAVMKNGRKTAVRLLATEAEARTMATGLGAGHYIEKRTSANVRCENYCSVARFCEQFQAMQPEKTASITIEAVEA